MPAERIAMRKIREILRLQLAEGRSRREVARSVRVSPSTVLECVRRAKAAGLTWPLPAELDDGALEARLYPPAVSSHEPRALPDFQAIHRELRRKHVTLRLLWQEYKGAQQEEGYQYSRFCELYRSWARKLDVVMRQEHRAGEKTFVDFSGDGVPIVRRSTGEVWEAALFLAALGASSFTFAEAYPSQQLRWWIEGHVRAVEYFDGVTEIFVPDQPRTSVSRPCWYDPKVHPTYLEWAQHTDTAIVPARPRKPRDKAKVESAVLVAQRWILAALRNHTFFSLEEANQAIREKLEELNGRKFQRLDVSRRELYEQLDRPALRPRPARRYELAEWSEARVNIDYHVDVQRHFYSVPFSLVHQRLDVRRTARAVELFHKGRRVASHVRSDRKGGFTTLPEHMPRSHREYLEWSPSRILGWAKKTGPKTAELAEKILTTRPHPALGYRSCLGILRLGKAHGPERLEAACARALAIGATSYKSVDSILKNGLDREPPSAPRRRSPVDHDNIRGSDYYDKEEEGC